MTVCCIKQTWSVRTTDVIKSNTFVRINHIDVIHGIYLQWSQFDKLTVLLCWNALDFYAIRAAMHTEYILQSQVVADVLCTAACTCVSSICCSVERCYVHPSVLYDCVIILIMYLLFTSYTCMVTLVVDSKNHTENISFHIFTALQ